MAARRFENVLGMAQQPSAFPGRSLRCGGRQGSSLRSDKLRERTKPFAAPWTAFLAAAGRVYKSC